MVIRSCQCLRAAGIYHPGLTRQGETPSVKGAAVHPAQQSNPYARELQNSIIFFGSTALHFNNDYDKAPVRYSAIDCR
jgi:hypothetical protein